ncbi:MAG TPA: DUF2262 domain-containing protein [Verrucomicrobiae bacterium]|nr:DUF2262 domain-containing protein [Verrucomicrobiae bacterium]
MLPELKNDPSVPGSLIGSLLFEGRELVLRITPDDTTTEQCLSAAAKALAALPDIDIKARDVAARTLLSNYNDNWRHYGRTTEGGSIEEVHDPELSSSDFKARLKMTCLETLGANCYTIFYDDGHMFAGHSVVITSFDGLFFSDTYAELFG